eukprot:TRINITY_DN62_c0_g1_i2.p1 TRINITY_DN62_c0_g1~~TRINITY_DN62_c0_g1_i2.p1  ORF type:complete len:123 (+),score=36.82 TRINITY_DN62_c0_g1_i2:212-580(+)
MTAIAPGQLPLEVAGTAQDTSKRLQKYLKMVDVGIEVDAVKTKMEFDGVDPFLLDIARGIKTEADRRPEEKFVPKKVPGKDPKKLCEHMTKAGVPEPAIKQKMKLAGWDPALVDEWFGGKTN